MTSDLDPLAYDSSPRLSFSQDFIQSNNPLSPPKPEPIISSDFNFTIQLSSTQAPSLADELFLNGKLLPSPLKNPNPTPDPITGPIKQSSGGKRSLWKFGRSSSLNCGRRSGMLKDKFLRSYSTGSDPPNPKPQKSATNKSGYYEANNRGGGASCSRPVPLFPKQRGLIGLLMCNCVVGGDN